MWNKIKAIFLKSSSNEEIRDTAAQIHNIQAIEAEAQGNYAEACVHWNRAIVTVWNDQAKEFYIKRLAACYEIRLLEAEEKIKELNSCPVIH